MKVKFSHQVFLGFGILFVIAIFVTIARPSNSSVLLDDRKFIDTRFHEYKEFLEDTTREEIVYQDNLENKFIQLGITSHHLPTATSFIADLYRNLLISRGPRKTFIILGPDHFEKGYNSVSSTLYPFSTPFGELGVNQDIVNRVLNSGVLIDDNALEGEHSIGVQAIFIKLFFPEAEIVPLIFRVDTNEESINKITEALADYRDEIIIIASVDFSHYLDYQRAKNLDLESKQMLSELNFEHFNLEHADSPPSLKVLGRLVRLLGADEVAILELSNSYDFTGRDINTTGYINALFSTNY